MNDPSIKNPVDEKALSNLKSQTPARIGVGRIGPRYATTSWLKFRFDHARAQDALYHAVSEELLNELGLFTIQTQARDIEEFLTRPGLGRALSEKARSTLKEKCVLGPQVQVYFADGLSPKGIEVNAKIILPVLRQSLQTEGIQMGTPFFLKYGRVAAQDVIGQLLRAHVVCTLIGERPGLATTEGMGAYLIFRPTSDTKDSDRSMISNIHPNGTSPTEAGLRITALIKDILAAKASGLNLIKT